MTEFILALGVTKRILFISLLGSFVLFLCMKNNDKKTLSIIGSFGVSLEKTFFKFIDGILFIFLGVLITCIILRPENDTQAFFNGLGWLGVIETAFNKGDKE